MLAGLLLISAMTRLHGQAQIRLPLKAVKVYELSQDLDQTIQAWTRLGLNAVFAPADLLRKHPGLRDELSRKGLALFLISPVFYNPDYLKQHPGSFAKKADGSAAKDDWVEFVCPSDEAYRQERLSEIVGLVEAYRPEVLSLDFIRYFAFWEMNSPHNPPKASAETCFCPRCEEAFIKEALGVKKPAFCLTPSDFYQWVATHHKKAWHEWKIGQITRTAQEIITSIKKKYPETKVNIHLVPWRHVDFDRAALRIIAQDAASLGELADFISPMCYAPMLGQTPEWIHDVCLWLKTQTGKPILPSIQVAKAYDEPEPSLANFEESLRQAWLQPSSGIVLWNWEKLSISPEKLASLQAFFDNPAKISQKPTQH
jgi:hypothetical protein